MLGEFGRGVVSSGVAAVWLFASVTGVIAHGGTPTLQLGVEVVHPGGTLEINGDMTTEGSVRLTLVADADADTDAAQRDLGTASADGVGHFQVFVPIPPDLSTGAYHVVATGSFDRAEAPILLVGPALAPGEDGQQPGQDEALAGVGSPPGAQQPAGAAATGTTAATAPPAPSVVTASSGPGVGPAVIAVVVGSVLALVFGAIVRVRARR
jgi:hypothetical protein